METIKTDMTIGAILQLNPGRTPRLVDIMNSYGLHCTGCSANMYETLEEGVRGHGLDEEVLKKLVTDLNSALDAPAPSGDFQCTEFAAKKVIELMKQDNKEGWALSVKVVSGGCSGSQYEFDFVENAKEEDVKITSHGMLMVLDKASFDILKGGELDFHDGLHGTGFKINNPNAKSSCGCGSSFS